jgi:hypothetical protein
MLLDIGDGIGDVVRHLIISVREQPFAETEPAVSSAHVIDEKQRRVAVFVFETFAYGVGMLVGRIHLPKFVQLLKIRHHDSSNRIFRIVPVDQ